MVLTGAKGSMVNHSQVRRLVCGIVLPELFSSGYAVITEHGVHRLLKACSRQFGATMIQLAGGRPYSLLTLVLVLTLDSSRLLFSDILCAWAASARRPPSTCDGLGKVAAQLSGVRAEP